MTSGAGAGSPLADDEFPNQLSSVDQLSQEQRHRHNLWRSNYHEASIYIEEGLNNDKFENHPRRRSTLVACVPVPQQQQQHDQPATSYLATQQQQQFLKDNAPTSQQQQQQQWSDRVKMGAHSHGYLLGGQYTTIETYILVHNRYFYQLDLAAGIVLMLLALFEPPAVEGYELRPAVHAGIEMFALGIIAIELLLKFRWMGPRRFFRHGRTVLKLGVLLVMNVEAIVILLRHTAHARYSRALRPIFLIDNHYCHGMRRAVRQIFQSLPPILDMFTLAMFFMFVFSIFGFYLFASNNQYFADMPGTVGNLLILATTASLPDVMMPSYAVSRWSAVFFVLFIIVHLFLLTNLTMAAVYESFTRREKEKFHKLLLHRRKACQEAFKLLVSRRQPNRIQYRQFMGLMRYLNRKCSMFDAYLIFKALDTDKNGSISLEEFYQIYDYINLEWRLIYPAMHWYDDCDSACGCVRAALGYISRAVRNKWFDRVVNVLIAGAALLQFVEATTFSVTMLTTTHTNSTTTTNIRHDGDMDGLKPDSVSTSIFIALFLGEAALRALVLGLHDYWADRWNRFDLLVLLVSLCGLVCGELGWTSSFSWVIVMRVLRLMRLFEFKRRYRDIWQTLTYIMLKRFMSMTCVVIILYYFFAIVGMELLGNYDLRNCCIGTQLESQFKYENSSARYYLNDFGDIVSSYLTLFSMTSNTYWLATMSAYAIVAESDWVRVFFGVYYLCSIIVMNIVIAFILESFLFRINYRAKLGKACDDTNLFTVGVTLSPNEVEFLRRSLGPERARGNRRDKNYELMLRALARHSHIGPRAMDDCAQHSDERSSLLGRNATSPSAAKQMHTLDPRLLPGIIVDTAPPFSATTNTTTSTTDEDEASSPSKASKRAFEQKNPRARRTGSVEQQPAHQCYLIYQAEQMRNKFSFTMKMYAEEVRDWLAEAERADQDEISAMINRNQIRAEHVAMARLARRSIAERLADPYSTSLINWPRGRSQSSSGAGFLVNVGLATHSDQVTDAKPTQAAQTPRDA